MSRARIRRWSVALPARCAEIALCLALSTLAAFGQRASQWRSFRPADGLADSFSTSITFSPRGEVLVKHPNSDNASIFDGYEFRTIPSPRPGTCRICETRTGQIWVIHPEGLQELRNGSWILHRVEAIAAEYQTNANRISLPVPILPVRQDRVLVLLGDRLIEFNAGLQPQTLVLLTASKLGLGRLIDLAAAADGGLWISAERGVAHLAGTDVPPKPDAAWMVFRPQAEFEAHDFRAPVPEGNQAVTLVCDRAADRALAHFDGTNWSVLGAGNHRIRFGWRGVQGIFHALTLSSAIRFEGTPPGLIQEDEDAVAGSYFDLAMEPGGAVWLATVDGIHRHAPLAWQEPPGLRQFNQAVLAIHEDARGRLVFLCSGSVLTYDGRVWRSSPLPETIESGLPTTIVSALLPDGSLVFDNDGVLFRQDARDGAIAPFTPAPSLTAKLLGTLTNGSLLFAMRGTSGSGSALQVYSEGKLRPADLPAPPPELRGFLWARSGQNGRLLLAGTNGVALLNGSQWQVTTNGGPVEATCAFESPDGRLWVGTRQGVWTYDGAKWTTVRNDLDRVNALARTREGSLWCATRNGLYRSIHDDWVVIGAEEGLPTDAVVEVFEDSQGRIWAGTTRGLALFQPEADKDAPRTTILNSADERVPASEASILIRFRGRDKWKFTPASRLLFSYRLDYRDWSPFSSDTSVTLMDLKSDKHYFQVRCMDRNGNVEPTPALLEFTVARPWYQETRLVLIAALGLAAAVAFAALAWNRHRRLVRSHAEIEQIVALRTQQLELANEELLHSQKMKALGTLAAGIAHDFNNILSIIKGSVQIIEGNLENREKVLTRTGRIRTVVQQGAEIVQAMLGFSRLPEQQFALCAANEVTADTIKLLGDHFLRRMKIEFEPAPELPSVPASKNLLQQILLNFIFNAADATEGPGRILLRTGQVAKPESPLALAPAKAAGYVFIAVQDFGCGIAPEILPRIFEPFFTTKGFSARRGTGLGLTMAYELAMRMGCGLKVASSVGGGSTFAVFIPVRPLPSGSALEPGAGTELTAGGQP